MMQTRTKYSEFGAITIISILFVLLSCIGVKSQNLDFRAIEIIREVLDGNGQITPELHSEFWLHITKGLEENNETLSEFQTYMDEVLLTASYWQYEVWKSARKSAEEGRVVKTSQYEEYKVKILESASTPEALDDVQQGIANAEMLIQSAAFNTLMHSVRGSFYVDIALIDQTLGSLEGSLQRAKNLLDPNWGG